MDDCPYSRALSLVTGWWSVLQSPKTSNFFRDVLDEFNDGGHQLLTLGPTGGMFL